MEFIFLGVRGSTPASGKSFLRVGGHTSCSLLHSGEKDLIFVDAGTGIIRFGQTLMKHRDKRLKNIHILFTHFHLDHLQGLHFFPPLYSSKAKITFFSALNPTALERTLNRIMGDRFFPVRFTDTPSQKSFQTIPPGSFQIGRIRISTCPLHHPQGSLAFKFSETRGSLVFASDTEHPEKGVDERLAGFSKDAEYLIYDAMFTPAEYRKGKQGWGHSTWQEGIKLAHRAGAKRLILTHFNPNHGDGRIGRILSQAKKQFPNTSGAREGKKLHL